MNPEENLKTLNIKLPKAPDPVGSYLATVSKGNFIFVSGQISIDEDGNLIKGKLGKDLNVDQGYKAAHRCALSIISQLKKARANSFNPTILRPQRWAASILSNVKLSTLIP